MNLVGDWLFQLLWKSLWMHRLRKMGAVAVTFWSVYVRVINTKNTIPDCPEIGNTKKKYDLGSNRIFALARFPTLFLHRICFYTFLYISINFGELFCGWIGLSNHTYLDCPAIRGSVSFDSVFCIRLLRSKMATPPRTSIHNDCRWFHPHGHVAMCVWAFSNCRFGAQARFSNIC
jgi:hypothetical protein